MLSVSAGHGHVIASQAIVAAAQQSFAHIEIQHWDILDMMPFYTKFAYRAGYNFVVKNIPAIWQFSYKYTDHNKDDNLVTKLRKKLEMRGAHKLFEAIRQFNPDEIICTHFLPAQIVQRWRDKGLLNARLWVVITDYISHRFWHIKGVDGYFVATPETETHLRKRGIKDEAVYVTGIPILPKYSNIPDRAVCAKQYGINPEKLTLLMVGGAAGVGGLLKAAGSIMKLPGDFQLIVLSGTNKRLYKRLSILAAKYMGRLLPIPFTKDFERLLAVADLVMTKPGGLTISECMAAGKAMIVFAPIPGQEECNAKFLVEHNAAVRAYSIKGLIESVGNMINDPDLIKTLSVNSASLGKPLAAIRILDIISKRDV